MDFQQVFERLDGLAEVAKQHLPRSIGVAAGQIFRDEAKARAPVFESTKMEAGANIDKPPQPGLLRDAIYLAYSENRSAPQIGQATYSVTWNASKAPHGHLQEFGHWGTNMLVKGKKGKWVPTSAKLLKPVWVPAKPFLRPAYDAMGQAAIQAGLDRGRERMTEILANPALLDQYR
jgi:HK97 gp10 family phage protein